jgi:4-amino-4-deoxy-L-arabinose transferase-like glycosyltransferase
MTSKGVSLILVFLALFCYSYFFQVAGWNQNSRMALIMSVVHHHQLNIDPYAEITGDKALYNGHYYSDKAIGTAVLGVPVYTVLSKLPGSGIEKYSLYLITLFVVSVPSAGLSLLLYQLMRVLGGSCIWALILTLIYSFGTLAFPFSTMLFGHQLAATFAFAAFFVLVKARLRSAPFSSRWLLFIAGALAGLAVLSEYPVILIAALLFIYAATFVRPKRRLLFYILGGAPAAALLLAYNWYTLDSPFSFAYSYISEGNSEFTEMTRGLFGIAQPRWSSFIEITLGPLGLLTQSPFLWLLPLGVWLMSRTAQWRRECALCVCVGLAFIIWNSGYYLPLGGLSPGARFLVPSLPFLIVPLVFLTRLPQPYALWTKFIVVAEGAWSMSLYFLICATGRGPLDGDNFYNPVHGFMLERAAREDLSLNIGMEVFGLRGIASLAPLAIAFVMALAVLLFLCRASRHASHSSF